MDGWMDVVVVVDANTMRFLLWREGVVATILTHVSRGHSESSVPVWHWLFLSPDSKRRHSASLIVD